MWGERVSLASIIAITVGLPDNDYCVDRKVYFGIRPPMLILLASPAATSDSSSSA